MKELRDYRQKLSFELENNPTFKKLKEVEEAIIAYEKVFQSEQRISNDAADARAKFFEIAKKYLREMATPVVLDEIKRVTGEDNSVRATRYLMGDKDFIKVDGKWTLREFFEEGTLPNTNN